MKNKPTQSSELLQFMLHFGRTYLANGGPTSRVEDNLERFGTECGYKTEVFATPTGLFITCQDNTGEQHTGLTRIKGTNTNLAKLCILERIFDDIKEQKLSLSLALQHLETKILTVIDYKRWQIMLATFISGFILSFNGYANLFAAFFCGLTTTSTWWITTQIFSARALGSTFRDFLGAFVALCLSTLFHILHPVSVEAYSIGAIILLVPGLAITNAISELADQNLVSGTTKLMQGILTVLALGLAFSLVQEIAKNLALPDMFATVAYHKQALPIAIIFTACSIASYAVIFKVPVRLLPFSTISGVVGWLIVHAFSSSKFAVQVPFVASLSVGILGMSFGRIFRVPSQVFTVPGIIVMLPGMLALTSFHSFATGSEGIGLTYGFDVAMTSVGIVFGLFTARIPALLFTKAK